MNFVALENRSQMYLILFYIFISIHVRVKAKNDAFFEKKK